IQKQSPELYDLLVAQNASLPLHRDRGPPGAGPRAGPRAATSPSPLVAYTAAAQQFAANTPVKFHVSPRVSRVMQRYGIPLDEAPLALDQLYSSTGPMKVNGVHVAPATALSVLRVPRHIAQ